MLYEFTGKVVSIGQTKSFGSSNFTKREIVVEQTDSKYPNVVCFTAKKDKCSILDGVPVGVTAKVKFSIDGRKWDGPNGVRYFTDLTLHSIDCSAADGGGAGGSQVPYQTQTPGPSVTQEDDANLPF